MPESVVPWVAVGGELMTYMCIKKTARARTSRKTTALLRWGFACQTWTSPAPTAMQPGTTAAAETTWARKTSKGEAE